MGYYLLLTQGTEVCLWPGLTGFTGPFASRNEFVTLISLSTPVIVISQFLSFSSRPACNGCKAGYKADV